MPRPRLRRQLKHVPHVTYYKPQGVPLRQLETEVLSHEEWEALRLRHIESCDQHGIAKRMKTSQSSVQRILTNAHDKLARAVIHGKAVRIVTE